MDLLLNRFRNLTVLVLVVAAQLLLLAWQVKSNQEIRLIRVWAVTAVTPLARVVESIRSGTTGFFTDYFYLLDVREENRRMKAELGRIKLENQFLKTELSTADRARALAQFQSRSPSRSIAARIIGNGTGANSRVVYIDRGSTSGVQRGMAVITPDGIVGKVIDSFPMVAQVLMITDPTFAAGVISEKHHTRGTLKGDGKPACIVEHVQNEEKLDPGEWFFTTGDDRVFPKGLPVGQVSTVRQGRSTKEIYVTPSGFKEGFEEVLVVLEGVHQPIPDGKPVQTEVRLQPPPPDQAAAVPASDLQPKPAQTGSGTDADRIIERYRKIDQAEGGHGFGQKGNAPPNFNINPDDPKYRKAPVPAVPAAPGAASQPVQGVSSGIPATPKPAPAKPQQTLQRPNQD